MINPQPYQLFTGDSLEVLKGFADNSIDAIVTDSPYGLGKEPDPMKVLRDWLDHGYHEVKAKGGFMGKAWDNFVPQPLLWKECYRVLKPGGYLLSFFGTRTYDWGVMAIRLAGFSVRDQIAWLYGSGFPKSLDISKAIDSHLGADRKVTRNGSKRPAGTSGQFDPRTSTERMRFDEPATEAAKQWDGWGTALKPANEPIVLAQKPMSEKTFAANVLKWGTGGINIDGCRVEFQSVEDLNGAKFGTQADIRGGKYCAGVERGINGYDIEANPAGRWPANVVHDGSEEVLQHFPYTESGKIEPHHIIKAGLPPIGTLEIRERTGETFGGDSGSAARFFYTAKASADDRDEGLDGFEVKPAAAMQGNLVDCQRLAGNGTPINTPQRKNTHPTVKPTDLMRWLVRLVTPPAGIVLDPFCGSGSTGKACMFEGFRFVGIDKDPQSIALSQGRIEFAKKEAERIARMPKQINLFEPDPKPILPTQQTLFNG